MKPHDKILAVASAMLADMQKADFPHGCTFSFIPVHLDNVVIHGHIDLLRLAAVAINALRTLKR